MKKTFLLFSLFSLLISGCAGNKTIPEKDMVAIFYDIYLSEGMLESAPELAKGTDSLSVYAPLIRKHGYDEDQFRAAVNDYLRDPETFHEVMNTVKARLEQTLRKTEETEAEDDAAVEGRMKPATPVEGVESREDRVMADEDETPSVEEQSLDMPDKPHQPQKVRKNRKVSKKDIKALEESLSK